MTTCRKWQARRRPNFAKRARRRAFAPCGPRMPILRSNKSACCPSDDGFKCDSLPASEPPPGRMYNCQGCRRQVLICSRCDRGNAYCTKECSVNARREKQREARKRHQGTENGRRDHAARQRQYRQRQRERAAGGAASADKALRRCASPSRGADWRREADGARVYRCRQSDVEASPSTINVTLPLATVTDHGSPARPINAVVPLDATGKRLARCDRCGRPCSLAVRSTFLRR